MGASGEAAQAENSLERLGPVADRDLEAAAKLAFTQPQLASELVHALARVHEPNHSGLHRAIRRSACHELARGRYQPHRDLAEIGIAAELLAGIQMQIDQTDAAVTQFFERDAECGSTRPRQEPNAEDHLAGLEA